MILNLWKAVNARIYRCRVAFLHFLTKTHQNMANRIREAHSLRSVSIADGLSVPAGHLTHSALVHSGALTPLRRFAALFRPLRTPCSGVLSSCADGFPAGAGAWHSVRYADDYGHKGHVISIFRFFSIPLV